MIFVGILRGLNDRCFRRVTSGLSARESQRGRLSKTPKRFLLLLELLGAFIAAPSLLYFWAPVPLLPVLLVFAAACGLVLTRDPAFDRANLWRPSALAQGARAMLIRFAICAAVLFAIVCLSAPGLLFALPRQRPVLWLLIVLLYPLLSVYPQELIYRAYFLHRYRMLFPKRWLLLALNVLLFGYVHIIFHNWIAVILSVAGGTAFVITYERSRSTLLVSIEHSLFGCLLFTIGLGRFFYTGHFLR